MVVGSSLPDLGLHADAAEVASVAVGFEVPTPSGNRAEQRARKFLATGLASRASGRSVVARPVLSGLVRRCSAPLPWAIYFGCAREV